MCWVLGIGGYTADLPVVVLKTFEIDGVFLQMLSHYFQQSQSGGCNRLYRVQEGGASRAEWDIDIGCDSVLPNGKDF